MLESYRQLLTYIKSAVTRNYSEKSINSILDYISNAKQMDLLQNFYELTLESLKHAKNERLWFKTNTKLASLYLHSHDWSKLQFVLKQLRQSCLTESGEEDSKKGTQLLEIIQIDIQMSTIRKDNKKLKQLYEKSKKINSAIPHPLTKGKVLPSAANQATIEKWIVQLSRPDLSFNLGVVYRDLNTLLVFMPPA